MEGKNGPYQQYPGQTPPDAQSIKDMVKLGGLIALIFGIINLLWGIPAMLILIGIVGIIFGIIDLLTWRACKDINKMIDKGQYEAAKSKTLVWMIVSILFGGFLPGIFLLIAYLKYDNLSGIQSKQGAEYPPPPPPP